MREVVTEDVRQFLGFLEREIAQGAGGRRPRPGGRPGAARVRARRARLGRQPAVPVPRATARSSTARRRAAVAARALERGSARDPARRASSAPSGTARPGTRLVSPAEAVAERGASASPSRGRRHSSRRRCCASLEAGTRSVSVERSRGCESTRDHRSPAARGACRASLDLAAVLERHARCSCGAARGRRPARPRGRQHPGEHVAPTTRPTGLARPAQRAARGPPLAVASRRRRRPAPSQIW